ncbi:alpha-glucosidase C-terminal domain-containing protein [Paenibacillus sp. FSL L8-0470]|uniref:alpha-glucosidase C-terminal domain-containing protein n=1 Tax=unclassified Paenibacillus TaxID=185978 RepID=UPI0030FBCB5F
MSLRNEVPALRDGGIREYSSGNRGIMAFERITAGEQVLVVHNLTGGTQNISLHPGTNTVTYSSIIKTFRGKAGQADNMLTLPAYSTIILE